MRISECLGNTVERGFDQRTDHLFVLGAGELEIEVEGSAVFDHQGFFPHLDVRLKAQLLLAFFGCPP